MSIIKRCIALLPVLLFMTIVCHAEAVQTMRDVYLARLQADDFVFCGRSYAGKKEAMIMVASDLLDAGYEPSFVAGVIANVAREGSFGRFENITGYTEKRLLEVFTTLKPCSESGKKHQNYVAHINGFTTYDGCGHSHPEYAQVNGKYIYRDLSLSMVEKLCADYAAEGWKAKFGLGSLQWTGSATGTLVGFYRDEVGPDADTITMEQCRRAELRLILYQLQYTHRSVYANWKTENGAEPDTETAAYNAGYRVCYYYEVPANRAVKAVERGDIAREVYAVMAEGLPDLTGKTVLELPEGLTEIGSEAFRGTDAEAVVIPRGCTSIAAAAFSDCPSLTIVILPVGLVPDAGAFGEAVQYHYY